ncbi:hypothetical protein KOW79_021623 [Hemibagrus wyckioides]|uniref:Uncharacterized protein n=1 Tax=Hemibagrus wyckioides TaxID=337641 RepID=A0A9D3N2K8_9TELE|nr:hypothetical protein KOW79_021623 [Hemibagrus wyckioides]
MLVFVCFIAALVSSADGQANMNDICKDIQDFHPCKDPWTCDLTDSQCFCKDSAPYCRCNNYIDEFYLGKTCSQKWTTLTFALVATLPGVALAFVIGVSVHLAYRFGKSNKIHREGNELTHIPEQDLFPGVVFASDMKSCPSALPLHPSLQGPMPVQMTVPTVSSRPYSVSDNTQFGEPPMGAPRPQYSYTGGGAQVFSNPYASARKPYEEQNMSVQPYNQHASPQPYEEQRMAPPPAQPFGAPEYGSAFPRAQISRLY